MSRSLANTPAMPASSCCRSGWVALDRIDTQNGSRDSTPCQSEKMTRPDNGTCFIQLPRRRGPSPAAVAALRPAAPVRAGLASHRAMPGAECSGGPSRRKYERMAAVDSRLVWILPGGNLPLLRPSTACCGRSRYMTSSGQTARGDARSSRTDGSKTPIPVICSGGRGRRPSAGQRRSLA